jgi:hypothetical protein
MTNRKLGSLEAYAASIEATPPPLARGRGGRRLAMLLQIVRAWHALASQPPDADADADPTPVAL